MPLALFTVPSPGFIEPPKPDNATVLPRIDRSTCWIGAKIPETSEAAHSPDSLPSTTRESDQFLRRVSRNFLRQVRAARNQQSVQFPPDLAGHAVANALHIGSHKTCVLQDRIGTHVVKGYPLWQGTELLKTSKYRAAVPPTRVLPGQLAPAANTSVMLFTGVQRLISGCLVLQFGAPPQNSSRFF